MPFKLVSNRSISTVIFDQEFSQLTSRGNNPLKCAAAATITMTFIINSTTLIVKDCNSQHSISLLQSQAKGVLHRVWLL